MSERGDFLGCTADGCTQGEWSGRAVERGWTQIPDTQTFLCPAHKEGTTYVDDARATLMGFLPDHTGSLLDLYTLLVLVTGEETTLKNVHDAWAVWSNRTDPTHRSIVPLEDLPPATQELDRTYVEAIRLTAHQLRGNCPCGCEGCLHRCAAHKDILCSRHPQAPVIAGRCGLCPVTIRK